MPYEQGPIRPPSEAESLLIRFTRGCPWNRCTFCPVYKRGKFSKRKVAEVLDDIEELAQGCRRAQEISWSMGYGGKVVAQVAQAILQQPSTTDALAAATLWLLHDRGSVFLQDSDALLLPTESLTQILSAIRKRLPGVKRVTCYSRSATLAQKGVRNLEEIRLAGLDRVHVGMESGSAKVLAMMKKGATPAIHIKGGVAAVQAGLELSEYVMPGLGGRDLSREHAIESAAVIREISPHFVRLRSLGLRRGTPLAAMVARGEFVAAGDDEVVREIRLFIEKLGDTRTTLVSDHILNLLGNLEGKLPEEKSRLLQTIDDYLALPEREKEVYRLARRAALLSSPADMGDPYLRQVAEEIYTSAIASGASVDEVCAKLLERMI